MQLLKITRVYIGLFSTIVLREGFNIITTSELSPSVPTGPRGHTVKEDKQHALLLIHSTFPQAHLHVLIKARLFPLLFSEKRNTPQCKRFENKSG